MKKFLVSICLLFSVFTVAVYAETEQDGINRVIIKSCGLAKIV